MHRYAVDLTPCGCANGCNDRRRRRDGRQLRETLRSERPPRTRLFHDDDLHRGHVLDGRKQIVGESRVLDHTFVENHLFEQRHAEPLRGAPFDLADHLHGVESPAHILSRVDPNHTHEPEFGIYIDDRPMGRNAEIDVYVSLAVLIRLIGVRMTESRLTYDRSALTQLCPGGHQAPVAPNTLIVEVVATHPLQGSGPGFQRCLLHRTAGHLCLPRRGGRTCRPDVGGVVPHDLDLLHGEHAASNLHQNRDHALSDLGRCRMHPRTLGRELDARIRVVVETLRKRQVLDPNRVADPPDERRGRGGETTSAGQAGRVVVRQWNRHDRTEHLRRWKWFGDLLARRREVVPGLQCVLKAKIERIHAQSGCETIHLCLVGKADLVGTKPSHRPRRRIVRAHRIGFDERVGASVRTNGEVHSVCQHGVGGIGVCAAVQNQLRIYAHQIAVLIGLVPIPHMRAVSLDVTGEALEPAVHHLHRTPGS